MNETTMGETNFVAYEYRTKEVKRDDKQLYEDCYKSFGWRTMEESISLVHPDKVQFKMKRDRKLKNRSEVHSLQHKAEMALEAIGKLEESKTSRATMTAIIVGFIGTAFMAGATFSFLAGNIFLCVVLAVPGFIGWGFAYPLYKSTCAKQTVSVAPMIDEQYDIVYRACEQASALL